VSDDFSHECIDIFVDFAILGAYVTRVLDQAANFRCLPAAVRTEIGPELTRRASVVRATSHGIRQILIAPGKPMQTGYIERFDGTFRNECLNVHWFLTHTVVEDRRFADYENQVRGRRDVT
jgi:putative transposase